MFNKTKYFEKYSGKGVFEKIHLDRVMMVSLSLLVGSDYTEGIKGIGIVSAVEILKAFGGDLKRFKLYWDSVQADPKKKADTDKNSVHKLCKRIKLPASFPDQNIIDAYLKPKVSESLEPFSWGEPDLDGIRDFMEQKLNWSQGKVDKQLLPVLEARSKKGVSVQTSIQEFFNRDTPTKHASSRVQRFLIIGTMKFE